MNSMTGFGRAEVTTKNGKFTTEVASVNNRFLEISLRLPRSFFSLEPSVRQLVSSKLKRGKVHLFVNYEMPEGAPEKYPVNQAAARSYYQQLKKLNKELKLVDDIKLSDLLALPEICSSDQTGADQDKFWPPLKRSVEKAVTSLIGMRKEEGQAMARDMAERLTIISRLNKEIMAKAPQAVLQYRQRLTDRIEELLARPAADQVRLEEEIAVYSEKTDIAEECTRMISHVEQFRATMKQKGSIGKTINFILQEMNREANTIASKASEISITKASINVKDEVERLRELVQNVE
ncbi:MAG: YicC family protein [candidate division Zixibacteria bacterium]|nr:YicC family protein [candidate division Zixibacteria bacterium]MDH3935730.1 YicC family protein [candidate division Zixibacteria bacterium]MDH4033223.1 YicC family protein [candidate division Zixibacteria bacterium]